jgi:putative ABC transport system substrate-binding protein
LRRAIVLSVRAQAWSVEFHGRGQSNFFAETSICALREVMEAGALISYGVNLVDVFRDVAALVDQVARLGNAGEIPMRAPSHFHTAFNLKTAKALGLTIPDKLLALADEVIE